MIKLTKACGRSVYVDPDRIVVVEEVVGKLTLVYVRTGSAAGCLYSVIVKEKTDEVTGMMSSIDCPRPRRN